MHFWLTVAISFLSFACVAQNGGNNVFSFLEIPLTAKSSAVGGDLINNKGEIEAISDNPSLLDSTLHNDLLFSYVNYIGDINLGYVAYAYQYKDKGTFAASIANVNYGDFVQTNDFGDELGAFKVADYQFNLSFSKSLNDYFSVGTTLKNIYSAMEIYRAYGIGMDIGASYQSKNKSVAAGAVISNIGSQIIGYTSKRESFPFELKAGISKKLGHAPFRFSLFANNLQKWDLTLPNGSDSLNRIFTFDKLMRHIVLSAEIVPSDNFFITVAYDYRRRQELKIASRGGMLGFAFGTGFNLKMFGLSFSRSIYHFAGASNHITITTNLDRLKTKVIRKK